jgi:hypothetical protein
LGVLGVLEAFFRAFEAEFAYRISEDSVGLLERLFGGRGAIEEIAAHAYFLSALPGKEPRQLLVCQLLLVGGEFRLAYSNDLAAFVVAALKANIVWPPRRVTLRALRQRIRFEAEMASLHALLRSRCLLLW